MGHRSPGVWKCSVSFFLGLTAGAFLITILTYGLSPPGLCSHRTALRFYRTGGHNLRGDYHFFGFRTSFPVVVSISPLPNLSSAMAWMITFTMAMIIIYALECFFLLRCKVIAWSQDTERPGHKFYKLLAGEISPIPKQISNVIMPG